MLLATVGLVRAANVRIQSIWLDGWVDAVFVIAVGPLWIYDFHAERRNHPATLAGRGIIFLGKLTAIVV